MRNRRILAAFSLSCLLLMTACSKAAPTRQTPPTSQVQPGGDITTVVIGLLPPDDNPAMNELIRVFQEEHPSIRIEKRMMKSPLDADPMLRNKQVDLIDIPIHVRQLTAVRLLQPLDPYIERSKLDWQAIGRMGELQVDGRIYELPYSLSPLLLLYNEAICQAAGLGAPTKSWTWDDLRLAARKAAKGSGTDRVWGFAPGYPWWEFALYVQGETSDLKWWADGPAVKRGLEYFGGLIQTDGSAPFVPKTDPPTVLPISPDRNNAALAIIQVRNLANLSLLEQQSNVKLGLAPTPLTPGMPPIMGAVPHQFGMAAGSPVQEAAWSFLAFMAGPKGAEIVAKLGYMPAYRTPELMQSWLQHKTARMDGLDELMNRSVRLIPEDNPTSTEAQRVFMLFLMEELYAGQRTPEEAFVRYQDALPRSSK